MNVFFRGVLFLIFALVFAGCATDSNEISLKKMSTRERVYVGRVKVKFNEDQKPKCEIYLNYDVTPSIKLSEDGLVIYKTDRENFRLRSLACFHLASPREGAWHYHTLDLNPIDRPTDREKINYFGDLEIDWKFDASATVIAAREDREATSLVRTGRVNDSGELVVKVLNQFSEMQTLVTDKWPEIKEKNLTLQESLVTLKK